MSRIKNTWRRMMTGLTLFVASGSMLAFGCSGRAIEAMIAGLDAAGRVLDDGDDDISFSDWLESEFF